MIESVENTLIKLTKLIQEAIADGHGEVVLKVVVQSGKVTMVHLSKTQSIKVAQ